mmetsp:Transcript_12863/g.22214  ORF Transcript_12863/g.22214 Transcript_12863/m.22214 type:complete len:457 (+) Transcript_12863:92-1462(+)
METPDKYHIANFLEEHGWATGEYSDITLHFRGESFTIAEKKLHRLVLAQSPYFRALFSGGFKESLETKISIQIDDGNITEEAVLGVLNGLYKAHHAVPSDISKLLALLSAASMFQVEFLVDIYTAKALKELDASVLYDVIMTGYRYSLKKLIAGCFAWLRSNPEAMTESGNAGRLPVDLVSKTLKDDALWASSEWERYQIAKRFAVAKISQKAVEAASSPEPDDCYIVSEANEVSSTAVHAANESEFSKKRKRSALENVPQDYSNLFRLLHLSHCSCSELEQIEADGLVDKEQIQDAYRYSKRLMTGALKDSDKEDIHSCRLGFEIANVLTPTSPDEARTPWFFFAGDEWQIRISKSPTQTAGSGSEEKWVVGVDRRPSMSSVHTADTGAFRYNRQEHIIALQLFLVTTMKKWCSGTWNLAISIGRTSWGALRKHPKEFVSETGTLRVIVWMKHMG